VQIVSAVILLENNHGGVQLVDVGMEDAVHKSNARGFVRILVRDLDMDLPNTAGEGSFAKSAI
jgi:hypothetical protein